jgi:hypothetical protein
MAEDTALMGVIVERREKSDVFSIFLPSNKKIRVIAIKLIEKHS